MNSSASPRIISPSGSCTSHVAKLLLDAEDRGDHHRGGHPALPTELVGLMLRAIALDSDGLKRKSSFDVDFETARRLHERSTFRDEKLKRVMKRLDDEMTRAKKDLDQLGVRDLLRRDWKGDTSVPRLRSWTHR